jgi:hypothetical protein
MSVVIIGSCISLRFPVVRVRSREDGKKVNPAVVAAEEAKQKAAAGGAAPAA